MPHDHLIEVEPRPGERHLADGGRDPPHRTGGRLARAGSVARRSIPHRAILGLGTADRRGARAPAPPSAWISRTPSAIPLLRLHEWNADFAVWCSYKYLNAGPGAIGGCFVHERHAGRVDLPRFAGWWGQDAQARFQMGPDFRPMRGAQGWQISNPPVLSTAPLLASLEIFRRAGIAAAAREIDCVDGLTCSVSSKSGCPAWWTSLRRATAPATRLSIEPSNCANPRRCQALP